MLFCMEIVKSLHLLQASLDGEKSTLAQCTKIFVPSATASPSSLSLFNPFNGCRIWRCESDNSYITLPVNPTVLLNMKIAGEIET